MPQEQFWKLPCMQMVPKKLPIETVTKTAIDHATRTVLESAMHANGVKEIAN